MTARQVRPALSQVPDKRGHGGCAPHVGEAATEPELKGLQTTGDLEESPPLAGAAAGEPTALTARPEKQGFLNHEKL